MSECNTILSAYTSIRTWNSIAFTHRNILCISHKDMNWNKGMIVIIQIG